MFSCFSRFSLLAYPVLLSLLCAYILIFRPRFLVPYSICGALVCPSCRFVCIFLFSFRCVCFVRGNLHMRLVLLLICILFIRPASLPRGNLPGCGIPVTCIHLYSLCSVYFVFYTFIIISLFLGVHSAFGLFALV